MRVVLVNVLVGVVSAGSAARRTIAKLTEPPQVFLAVGQAAGGLAAVLFRHGSVSEWAGPGGVPGTARSRRRA